MVAATTTVSIIVYLLSVIGMWISFRKAGRRGWLSIIPVVNTIMICLIGWRKVWPFILEIVIGGIGLVLAGVGGLMAVFTTDAGIDFSVISILGLVIVGCILMVVALIIYIMMTHRFSKSFGHGAGWTVGLILIPLIMYLVLAFGKSEYIYEKKHDFGKKSSTAE